VKERAQGGPICLTQDLSHLDTTAPDGAGDIATAIRLLDEPNRAKRMSRGAAGSHKGGVRPQDARVGGLRQPGDRRSDGFGRVTARYRSRFRGKPRRTSARCSAKLDGRTSPKQDRGRGSNKLSAPRSAQVDEGFLKLVGR